VLALVKTAPTDVLLPPAGTTTRGAGAVAVVGDVGRVNCLSMVRCDY